MSKYRIIKYDDSFSVTFKVQKKSFLGFWYNFNNYDGYISGYYDTEAEAIEAIKRDRAKTIVTIIKV